ncbi:putative MFS-type transporter [Ceratocystis platani]|uniref:Putative MFS-type transporter n=1 Tax=Ceratocystis fimbriata f. sp. platani TaxID=88771 RepID=A0A0F8B2M6_CERFI|nr:putative MFS-type transporter [Ceratocystis platani]
MDEKKSHPFDWPGAPGSSEEAANDSATSSSTKFRPPSSIKKDRYRPRLEYEHEQPDHSDYDDDDDDDESIHSNDPSQHDGHCPCGVLGDIFTPAQRGVAMAGYAMAVVGGPALGPIVSAAFVQNPSLGWRWAEYFAGILQCIMLALAFVLVDESYPPQLLVHKARSLRLATGNWALHAEFEEWDPEIAHMAKKFLLRPVQLLCSPICLMMSLYASFCYGILYMQLGAIPIIFYETRGALLNVFNQSLYNKASALHKV